LFGINETGKSNILRACALLDSEYQEKYNWKKDCFKENKREGKTTEINYYFDFVESELVELRATLEADLPEPIIEQIKGVQYWIEGDTDSEIYYGFKFFFKDETKIGGYFKKKKVKEVVTTEPQAESAENTEPILQKASDIPEANRGNYEEVAIDKVGEIIAEIVDDQIIEEKLPSIIHWDSSSKFLINGTIDLNVFKDKPSEISPPLLNMFKFLDLDEDSLKTEITEALKETTDRHKLASDLSTATTKHLNTVWKEHAVEVQVTIDSNGSCDVHFADKDANTNFYEMQDRSDGFQRFISFILTLSAENLNEELTNTLILLDEPEVHLHPSGIEYLKDELLNIAKNNNYILAASHSIFLVDKKCIGRHITVKKVSGKTSVSYVSSENPFQEEVVFRALNTSIYELVQPFNIIFEGLIDSDIFLATKHKFRTDFPGLVNIGGIGATGAPEVKKYEKFFRGNLLVKAIAIFDSDSEGRRELNNIKNDSLFPDRAFELKDIYDLGKSSFELEDLLPKEVVLESAKILYKYDFLAEINQNEPILDEIKRIKNDNNITDDKNLKILKSVIVKAVLRETDSRVLTKDQFKSKYANYYKFLKELETKISSIS
jgi:predicted ATP-dependent endonuclease of OLD family